MALRDEDDSTPRHDLMCAVFAADLAGIDAALRRGARFSDEDVQVLLHAAWSQRPRLVAHLLERGATMAAEWPNCRAHNARDELHGTTALHCAAAAGDCETLRLLLAADGQLFLNRFDEVSRTPLIAAADVGHAAAVQLLLKAGSPINARDEANIGNTAVSVAVSGGHLGIVRMLLDAGAYPTIPGWMMLTAVHKAQLGGDRTRPILELFRERLGRDRRVWKRLLLDGR